MFRPEAQYNPTIIRNCPEKLTLCCIFHKRIMDVLSFHSPPDPLVDFSGVTAELMGPFLMADDVNQLEILSCEQQFVEIIHVYISALITIQCLSECRDHSPLLFYPEKIYRLFFVNWISE